MQNLDSLIHLARVSSAYGGGVTIILLGLFLLLWLKEPRRLLNGITFSLFFISFFTELALLIFSTGNLKFIFIMGMIFIVLAALILVILLMAWALLLWNAIVVWKRESHTMSNMLTLFLAIFLVAIWFINLYVGDRSQFLPPWLNVFLSGLPMLGIYISICAFNFLINDLLYQVVPRHYKDQYLIVLGAGLINGDQVSRLLGSRIDRAIAYAKKQEQKRPPLPKIIFSGGQGPDETVSEAKAMSDYAINQGWNPDLVILEDKSRNTLQNMAFSKKIILADNNNEVARTKFFSNNYHIFRAGLFAKSAGIAANGVGAKTKFYFLPNALIREFIAVFLMNKRRHIIVMSLIFILIVLLTFVSVYNGMQPRMH